MYGSRRVNYRIETIEISFNQIKMLTLLCYTTTHVLGVGLSFVGWQQTEKAPAALVVMVAATTPTINRKAMATRTNKRCLVLDSTCSRFVSHSYPEHGLWASQYRCGTNHKVFLELTTFCCGWFIVALVVMLHNQPLTQKRNKYKAEQQWLKKNLCRTGCRLLEVNECDTSWRSMRMWVLVSKQGRTTWLCCEFCALKPLSW